MGKDPDLAKASVDRGRQGAIRLAGVQFVVVAEVSSLYGVWRQNIGSPVAGGSQYGSSG